MKKLSKEQKRAASDYLSNIAVAWFVAGVIAPLFSNKSLTEIIIPAVWGTTASIISFWLSLWVLKGGRK